MSRLQINVRLSDELVAAIDEKRVALRDSVGSIPSRSDVVRLALEAYLGVEPSEAGIGDDRPKGSNQKRR